MKEDVAGGRLAALFHDVIIRLAQFVVGGFQTAGHD